MVHPVVAGDLLIFDVGQPLMDARQDGMIGTMLAQFVSETRLLRKESDGVGVHLSLRVRIFDGPGNRTHAHDAGLLRFAKGPILCAIEEIQQQTARRGQIEYIVEETPGRLRRLAD